MSFMQLSLMFWLVNGNDIWIKQEKHELLSDFFSELMMRRSVPQTRKVIHGVCPSWVTQIKPNYDQSEFASD